MTASSSVGCILELITYENRNPFLRVLERPVTRMRQETGALSQRGHSFSDKTFRRARTWRNESQIGHKFSANAWRQRATLIPGKNNPVLSTSARCEEEWFYLFGEVAGPHR